MINIKKLIMAAFSALLLWLLPVFGVSAGTIFNSPFVEISPDGQAWTTCAGDTHNYHYTPGYTVTTGLSSDMRPLQTGEHYYTFERIGSIPIGRWTVLHQNSQCIHDYIPIDVSHKYHGVEYGTKVCAKEYTQGWNAYCADCAQPIANILMYMCENAAKSITYIETGMKYYYLCPNFETTTNEDGSTVTTFCRHLEQGSRIDKHNCKKISWNQYQVVYDKNEFSVEEMVMGVMQPSFHMYNNETIYEGKTVSPVTRLSKVGYTVPGYEFTGWNTKADGTGTRYADQEEIFNLTTADYNTDAENGTITLYAQWVRSDSTLEIDPAGGSYFDNPGITSVTQPRLSNYVLNPSALAAPGGAPLSFETNGGTAADGSAVASVIATQHFTGWVQEAPFNGRLVDNTYYFLASKGNVDRVTAKYVPNPIELPGVKKENFTFGGWYYDADFKRAAGGAGDAIIIYENTTLYAQWVDLKLNSVENYTANGGKGAADLSWSQPDNNSKAYKVYRFEAPDKNTVPSADIRDWVCINDTLESGISINVSESFSFSGASQTYTVPSTGLYTLEAAGAQGGGGLGSEVTGNFWLQEGDVLTYDIGGQNGYGGAETGTNSYETSGRTAITSEKEGLLLAVGGGGGHVHNSDCYVKETTIANNSFLSAYTILDRDGVYAEEYEALIDQTYGNIFKISTHSGGVDTDKFENDTTLSIQVGKSVQIGDELTYFPTPGVGTFSFYYQDGVPPRVIPTSYGMDEGTNIGSWGAYAPDRNADRVIRIYATNGKQLLAYNIRNATKRSVETFYEEADCECDTSEDENADDAQIQWTRTYYEDEVYSGWSAEAKVQNGHLCNGEGDAWFENGGACVYGGTITLEIPEDVEGIYICYDFHTVYGDGENLSITNYLRDFKYTYTDKICGYEESAELASSSEGKIYVNRNVCSYYEEKVNSREGDGYFAINSKEIGFRDEASAANVAAPDLAAPNAVEENIIAMLPVADSAGKEVVIRWEQPEDNGTEYYFVVESHLAFTGTRLCSSNITHNTLTTGIAGYRYMVDGMRDNVVTATNSTYTEEASLQVKLAENTQYLHLAALDVAGNISKTTTFKISGMGEEPEIIIPWPVFTDQITVEEGEGIHPAPETDTYYVRCDGETPITLGFHSYMEGDASSEYQITHSIFESRTQGGINSRHIITTPLYVIGDGETVTGGSGLGISVEGASMLKSYMNTRTIRGNRNRDLDVVSEFVVESEANGETIVVTPIAGVETAENSVYSDYGADLENSIHLIGDCEAPVIYGTDLLNEEMVIDRTSGDVCLTLWAEDDISGVAEFCAQVYNEDNAGSYTFAADEDGRIILNITDEFTLFAGDFTITLIAVDNVGNRVEQVYHVTEFALETQVERILAPHEPVFQRGESGVLTVDVWGHVERVEVEFPEFLAGYSETFTYASPRYKEKETIQFMVPLETETDGSYEIWIRAYKDGNQLEDVQVITVSGNVLDDLRTRIR